MSLNNRQEPTSEKLIKNISYGKKNFSYVPIKHFYTWLDEHYPGWEFEVEHNSVREDYGFISVAGRLTVRTVDDGPTKLHYVKTVRSFGSDEVINSKQGGFQPFPYVKAAESDALKRCVVKLGGFNDVYFEVDAETESEQPVELSKLEMGIYFSEIAPYFTPEMRFKQVLALSKGLINIEQIRSKIPNDRNSEL